MITRAKAKIRTAMPLDIMGKASLAGLVKVRYPEMRNSMQPSIDRAMIKSKKTIFESLSYYF